MFQSVIPDLFTLCSPASSHFVFIFSLALPCPLSDFSKGSCPSPEFPQSSLNGDPKDACFQTGSAFSLTCIEDNARRAGISNLRCKESKGGPKWTKYLLQCIHKPYLFI
uniref:Sushi domain-containing protein n=1 Tax=Pundamilia nyererei TaxID=303518 RepID=A0A3B4GFE2_9CICH